MAFRPAIILQQKIGLGIESNHLFRRLWYRSPRWRKFLDNGSRLYSQAIKGNAIIDPLVLFSAAKIASKFSFDLFFATILKTPAAKMFQDRQFPTLL